MWNTPYDKDQFRPYAEEIGGKDTPTLDFLKGISQDLTSTNPHFKLVAGSISELGDNGNLYNTCLVYGQGGEIEAKHRKVHLFDIDVPGQYYMVSLFYW